MSSFLKVYDLLDVQFDHSLGESFYRDKVEEVYQILSTHNICQEDDGALVVFHREHKRFSKQPFIIRKSDGASNYATTDLATLAYREKEWQSDQIIYVLMRQLIISSNYSSPQVNGLKKKPPTLSHVWFGTILGEDNKASKLAMVSQ